METAIVHPQQPTVMMTEDKISAHATARQSLQHRACCKVSFTGNKNCTALLSTGHIITKTTIKICGIK
jgi:hypothetical protein